MISNHVRHLCLGVAGCITSLFAAPAAATDVVRVVTTVPELAWAATEIGGAHVQAKALLDGTENPHFVDAVPEFTRLVAEAQVVCVVGLDLEVGYMPPVLSRSGNAQVQPGGKGYCEAGKGVAALDKPTGPIDRSMGDVHPAGNPHFWLSPKALGEGAGEIAAALGRVDPAHAAEYRQGLAAFNAKLAALAKDVSARLAPLRALQTKANGQPLIIEYHKEFVYFLAQYELKSYGSIEEKPGVPPAAGRLAEVALAAKAAGVRVALAADYSPVKTLSRFQELAGLPVATVPTMMQAAGSHKTYAALQQHLADTLVRLARDGKLRN